MSKKYYPEIDALKGIAIFLVILGHSIIVYPINLHENPVCKFIYDLISSVHMPLFFIVSGFCFSYGNDYKKYLRNKINRILLPYLIFNIISFISKNMLPGMVNKTKSISDSLLELLTEGGDYWFLYVLFIIFLVYPLIYVAIREKKIRYYFLICISLFLILFIPDITIFRLSSVVYYILFFIIGNYLREFDYPVFIYKRSKHIYVICICLSTLLWLLLFRINGHLAMISSALAGIVVFYFCCAFKWFVDYFARYGKYSLQLYLLNGFLLVISRTLIVSIAHVSNPVIIIGFNMIIDFYLSYLFIKCVCERIGLFRKLMGML